MPGDSDEEQAGRQAIAGGDTGAWSRLGRLLSDQPGREREAEAAYREAIAVGDGDAWKDLGHLL